MSDSVLVMAGTGHRPEKLGGYSPRVTERLIDLAIAALNIYQPGRLFVGGALGWDTALAIAAMRLGIDFTVAVPFVGQEKVWNPGDQFRYNSILKAAKEVIVVSEGGYEAKKMQIRNQFMVDNCNEVIAIWNGSSGGTANCVKYAEKKGIIIRNLWKSWVKYKGV